MEGTDQQQQLRERRVRIRRHRHPRGRAEPRPPWAPGARAGWGGAAQGCCKIDSVAGTSPSRAPGRAQPRLRPAPPPRGVETKGAPPAELSRGGTGRGIWQFRAQGLQGLLRRGGRAGNDPGPGCGRASCSRIWRPRGEGRRLRAQRKVLRRRALSPFSERRGGGQRGRTVWWPGAVRVRGPRGWSPRGVKWVLSTLGVQPSSPGAARVMVPGGRKRRDSASVGARDPGVRRPGGGGAGELAAG